MRIRNAVIMSNYDIYKMNAVCKLAAEMLSFLGSIVRIGMSTLDLDDEAVKWAKFHNVINAPLGYMGYPKSICTSVNEVICHGIPSKNKILKDGDIINIDVTLIFDGYHGDTSKTFFVGNPSRKSKLLVETAKECLRIGINNVSPSNRIGDIGYEIQRYAENLNFSVVRDFVGHGIGKSFHSEPQIPHYGIKNTGKKIQEGMIFTIEPMINLGVHSSKILDDKWTVVTRDSKFSAQFEHTILVTENGFKVLTLMENEIF